MFDKQSKLNEIIHSEKIESTELLMNILINAVGKNYQNFGDLDQYLIGRVVQTLQWYKDNNCDFVIKFSKNEK